MGVRVGVEVKGEGRVRVRMEAGAEADLEEQRALLTLRVHLLGDAVAGAADFDRLARLDLVLVRLRRQRARPGLGSGGVNVSCFGRRLRFGSITPRPRSLPRQTTPTLAPAPTPAPPPAPAVGHLRQHGIIPLLLESAACEVLLVALALGVREVVALVVVEREAQLALVRPQVVLHEVRVLHQVDSLQRELSQPLSPIDLGLDVRRHPAAAGLGAPVAVHAAHGGRRRGRLLRCGSPSRAPRRQRRRAHEGNGSLFATPRFPTWKR